MNNEEKILEMLTQLQSDMGQLKQTVDQQGKLLETVDARSQCTAVLMEADIAPKLQLLYEGHGTIMESLDRLATKDRVEKLDDEIIVLKSAFKVMNQRIAELERAQ